MHTQVYTLLYVNAQEVYCKKQALLSRQAQNLLMGGFSSDTRPSAAATCAMCPHSST